MTIDGRAFDSSRNFELQQMICAVGRVQSKMVASVIKIMCN